MREREKDVEERKEVVEFESLEWERRMLRRGKK